MAGITAKWWRPSARRLPGEHRKSGHLPEYAARFGGRAGRLALCDWTEAPIQTSISTGRWWFECPEQMVVTVGPLDRHTTTAAIGFLMANREPNGVTWMGKRRPHKYQQSVRTLYYDLGVDSHVDAFLRMSRILIAYAAGKRRDDFFVEYPLKYVQPIDSYNGDVGRGYEQVWIQNGELTIKRFVEVQHRRRDWRRVKGGYANLAHHFTIPLKVARGYSDWAGRHLPYLFSDRLLPKVPKPHNLNSEWLPRARHALAWEAEPALFEEPEMYKDAAGVREGDPSSVPFTRAYLNRLDAYTNDRLRWDPSWVEKKHDVQSDVRYLKKLFTKVWPSVMFLQILCRMGLVLSREDKVKPKTNRQGNSWRPTTFTYESRTPNNHILRARAPP